MDREAWHAAIHGVSKSRTRLSEQESQASSCLRKGTPLASRVAQGVSGPSSSCVWNPRVFADDARGCSDPMDCSPPGSVVHGIFQARVLEWGAMAFSHEKKGTWGGVGGARSNPVTPPPEPLGQPRGTWWGGPGGKRDTHQRRCHQVWGRVAGRPRPGTEAWRGCRQGRGGMKTSMFP